VDAATIMALGRLTGVLEERQESYRRSFHDAFRDFTSGTVLDAYAEISDHVEVP